MKDPRCVLIAVVFYHTSDLSTYRQERGSLKLAKGELYARVGEGNRFMNRLAPRDLFLDRKQHICILEAPSSQSFSSM